MNISVFGLGYVGCVSLGCLAHSGHNVVGIDINPDKIESINSGKATIVEKDIDEIIKKGFNQGRIRATSNFLQGVLDSDISIVAVGTPSSPEGHLNLEHIYKVAREIGQGIAQKNSFHLVAVRSTVLPGTNWKIGKIIAEESGKSRNKDFSILSNPEFLREGSAVADYFNPPLTVIGSDNDQAAETLSMLYRDLPAAVEFVAIEIAEFIKYVNNSWHALKIAFANEVGNICKKMNVDSRELMNLFVRDTKLNISSCYLKPGSAYGGSCLPKDLKGLKTMAHDFYLSAPVIEAIENSNNRQKQLAVQLVEKYEKKRIGILGLSFKEGTDDLRLSPMVEMAEYLLGRGCKLRIYDMNVSLARLTGTNKDFIDSRIPHLADFINNDIEDVIVKSDLIIIAHNIKEVEGLMPIYKEKIFVDLVGITHNKYDNYEGICW